MNHDITPTDNLKYCNDALALREDIEVNFLLLGEYLYNIKEHRLYEPQWSDWIEYCFETRISQNNINKLIQIHKTFILEYGFERKQIATAGVSLLSDVLPAIQNKKDATEWLKKATLLTRQDLRKELTEHRTGIDMAKCKHKDTYTIEICRTCGQRHEVHDIKNEKSKRGNSGSKKRKVGRAGV
jgi:hypothetical protein